jgi:small-conductance mechanosensitive channel
MEMPDLTDLLASYGPWLSNTLTEMTQPWRLIQLGIIAALTLVAWGMAWALHPRLDGWMRDRTMTKRQARLLILIRDRLLLLTLAPMAWLTQAVMLEVTWPSRSYLIGLAAGLVTAWVLIGIASRMFRTKLMRVAARWIGWVVASLALLGLLPRTIAVLDAAAVDVGDTRLSLLLALKSAMALATLLWAANWLSGAASRRLATLEDLSPSMRVLSEKAIGLALYGIVIVAGLNAVGFDLTSLTVLSGAVGPGIGFGLQKVVSNLVSGVILLLDKSIKPGDVISLGDTFGWISGLNARYVSVVTRDGKEFLIPNEDLITGQVVNWSYTDKMVRLDVHFGVSYGADPHAVRKIAREAAGAASRTPPPRSVTSPGSATARSISSCGSGSTTPRAG